jgi:hypothetical protein
MAYVYVLCLLVHSLHTTYSPPSRPVCPSTLTHPGDTSNTRPNGHWSDDEKGLLSLAEQFKILSNSTLRNEEQEKRLTLNEHNDEKQT